MGLLDRAGTIEKQGSTKNNNPENLARKLISDNPVRGESPEHPFPGLIFDRFMQVLNVPRAALLLLNEETSEYTPWLTRGFDRTTVRRLHIPTGFPGLENNRASFLSDTQRKAMEPMLSVREYGLSTEILLVGIGNNEIPTGIILAAGFEETDQSGQSIIAAAELLAKSFSQGLTSSRERMQYSDDGGNEELPEWLEARGEQKSVLAILNLSKTVEILETKIPGIDRFHMQKDLLSILRNFTGRMGRLRPIGYKGAAVMFPRERLIDRDLFVHQLNHAFSSAFSQLNRNPEVAAVFYDWPEDRESVEKKLAEYF